MSCNCKKSNKAKPKQKYTKEEIIKSLECLSNKIKILENKLDTEIQESLYFKDV